MRVRGPTIAIAIKMLVRTKKTVYKNSQVITKESRYKESASGEDSDYNSLVLARRLSLTPKVQLFNAG